MPSKKNKKAVDKSKGPKSSEMSVVQKFLTPSSETHVWDKINFREIWDGLFWSRLVLSALLGVLYVVIYEKVYVSTWNGAIRREITVRYSTQCFPY